MKPDMSPAIATPAEAQWVEGELVRNLMRTARNTQLIGLLLIPIFLGVLWTDATLGCCCCGRRRRCAVAALRFWIFRQLRARGDGPGREEHLAFFSRYRFIWPLSALVWGLTTLLYFDRSPLADQFICWLIMAGLAMFSINSLSPPPAHACGPTSTRWR